MRFVATEPSPAEAAEPEPPRPRRQLLAYGDSLTAGFWQSGLRFAPYGAALVASLGGLGHRAELWMCGLSGLTVREFVRSLDAPSMSCVCGRRGQGLGRILKSRGPFDLVLLMGGTNDLGLGEGGAEAIFADLRLLHEACHAAGACTVALSVPPNAFSPRPPRPGEGKRPRPGAYGEKWARVNQLLADWARGPGAGGDGKVGVVAFVDVASIVPHTGRSPLWEGDGLHFSPAGSRRLGEGLAGIVGPLLDLEAPRLVQRAAASEPSATSADAPKDVGDDPREGAESPAKRARLQVGAAERGDS